MMNAVKINYLKDCRLNKISCVLNFRSHIIFRSVRVTDWWRALQAGVLACLRKNTMRCWEMSLS